MSLKYHLLLIVLCFSIPATAQKIFVEKTEGGAEKVLIDKLLSESIKVTFKPDSADIIIKPAINKMSLGRAKGGILIINAKSGDIISKTKELYGSARLVNGYDNPSADVLKRTIKKYWEKDIKPILQKSEAKKANQYE